MKTKHPPKVSVPTLSENIAKDGYELEFPTSPGDDVLDCLKKAGFRFNPNRWVRPVWYARRNPRTRAFAEKLIQILDGVSTLPEADAQATPATPAPPQPPAVVASVVNPIPATATFQVEQFA